MNTGSSHLFGLPAPWWKLLVLASFCSVGVLFGVMLGSIATVLSFAIFGLAPLIALMLWQRTFVRQLALAPSEDWLVQTYGGQSHTLRKHDVTSSAVTSLGRQRYVIVNTRSSGKLRFAIADETQLRLMSTLGLLG